LKPIRIQVSSYDDCVARYKKRPDMGPLYGMPVDYDIAPEKMHVTVVGTGKVSMSIMISIFDQIAADPRFHSHFTVLLDLRNGRYTAELADGDALAAVLKQKRTDFQNRLALVVPESLHLLARLYCTLVALGGFDKIQCFTDMEKAEAWYKDGRAFDDSTSS